ncbi:MFS transporter [Dechloromonas sp. XY25]|uniref:MFS transporter n=1 Tax=Dechloromonas hankyongensis TaxID=2908002 RepID=A0ABS9JZJ6_9RHOO|nr:MFS transporter [Dechloromonas hankyongensis]MCG2576322.1 MFS transporter [Dechloromonas hankyongensis]
MSPPTDRMSPEERRAGASLASIFALRMLGLFLILPVFSVYAKTLPGGDNLALVGFALGAYGLTQAVFQIPYGIASDIFGRKQVIVVGLLIFALGSFVAAWAPDMNWIIAGRVLQGMGAISAAVTALAADLTREEHRTKVMAMIGSSIGLVFALSLVGAPILYGWIGMSGLFVMTGGLALAAIGLLLKAVPAAPAPAGHEKLPLRRVVFDPDLLRLNLGIFVLHMVQMAMFVVLPHALVDHGGLAAASHWKVYLPAVLVSFAIMVPAIIAAERKDKMRPVFIAAVGLLVVVQAGLYVLHESLWSLAFWLLLFFVAFNVLEATLPSLVSRTAPPAAKGAALGVYNTTQAMGLFIGGALGGYIAQHFGDNAVFAACTGLVLIWLAVANTMNFPQRRQPAGAAQTV